jgi:hypothetical protein
MKHWCHKCQKYTSYKTIKFHDSARDLGDGSLPDYRTIKCKVCGSQGTYDFAPDRR